MIPVFLWAPLALAAAIAPPPEPKIYRRQAWRSEKLGDIPLDLPKNRIVVHHTAFYVSDKVKRLTGPASWRAVRDHARRVQFLHRHIRGWSDIGYHYLVDWEGRILEGRPVDRLGAHVENNNRGSIGVVLMGNFSKQRPTKKQAEGLKTLLAWLRSSFDMPAKEIRGHYAHKFTACPGTSLANIWDPNASALTYIQINPKGKR